MNISHLSRINRYDIGILLFPMSFYLVSFFLPIDSRLNNNIFYIFVFIPFFFYVDKWALLKEIATSTIFKISITFSLYLVMRSAFYFKTDLISYFEPARHFISWVVFMLISIGLFLESRLFKKIIAIAIWAALWGTGNLIYFYANHDLSTRLVYNGPVYHEILGASVYAFICVFIALVSMQPQQESFSLYLVSMLLFFCVLLSQSRGVIIPVILSIIAALPFARIKRILPFTISSVLILGTAAIFLSDNFGRLTELTSSYRVDIWLQVIKNSLSEGNWVFGNSLNANHEVTIGSRTFHHMHSGYVGTYFYGGIIGFFLLGALILAIGHRLYSLNKKDIPPLATGLYIFLIFIISTDNHLLLDGPSGIWFYFWLPVAFLSAFEIRKKQTVPKLHTKS